MNKEVIRVINKNLLNDNNVFNDILMSMKDELGEKSKEYNLIINKNHTEYTAKIILKN